MQMMSISLSRSPVRFLPLGYLALSYARSNTTEALGDRTAQIPKRVGGVRVANQKAVSIITMSIFNRQVVYVFWFGFAVYWNNPDYTFWPCYI